MVGIVVGQGSGLERSSAGLVGSRGQFGTAKMKNANGTTYFSFGQGDTPIAQEMC